MSFLDSTPDLSNAIFTQERLEYARRFLVSAIERHDPAWLKNPQGPLRTYWKQNGAFSACYLIEFCRVLYLLQHRTSGDSESIFIAKFKALLRPPSEKQYEDTYTELQVACLLSERVSPIALDPMVPRNKLSSPDRPRTTDFAIRLPDGDVSIEVTVFRFGSLDKWDRAIAQFQNRLGTILRNRQLRRIIDLEFALRFHTIEIPEEATRRLADRIESEDNGGLNLVDKEDKLFGTLQWMPLPHVTADGNPNDPGFVVDLPDNAPFATVGSALNENQGATGFLARIRDEDHSELLVRSVRNTLKLKRKQFKHDAPYILVVKLGHHRLRSEVFVNLLNERAWPNRDYEWITAICLFTPGRQFEKTDPPPNIKCIPNPNARHPMPVSLVEAFEGRKEFHLFGRRP